MAEEMKRLKLSMDEVFGILQPLDYDEVETERTPDYGNVSNPNWNSKLKIFSLGLHNAKESTLSNMVAKKTSNSSLSLYDFLDFVKSQQRMFFDLISSII